MKNFSNFFVKFSQLFNLLLNFLSINKVKPLPRPQNKLKKLSLAVPLIPVSIPHFNFTFTVITFSLPHSSHLQSTQSRDSEHVPINRKCTDVFFLILNIAFVIILVSLSLPRLVNMIARTV